MQNRRCDRCTNFMRREHISLCGESLEGKQMSAYHCMYCGRSEYGADASAGETSILERIAKITQFVYTPPVSLACVSQA